MAKKILAVDDEQHIMRLIKVNLERAGYEVVTAFDGKEALVKIVVEKPDLVVLDATMPGMDGFEVLQYIRKNPATRELPVIMLMAKAQDADVFRGWQSGVDCYLTKPFNPMELISFVKRIFSSEEWSEAHLAPPTPSSNSPTYSRWALLTEEELKSRQVEVRNHRRHDERVRQPILRLLRRLRGLPEPKVTVDQAIEITRDCMVNVKGFPENIREIPLKVTSELQHYQIRLMCGGDAGSDRIKVDMADGRIDFVEYYFITM